MLIEVLAPSRYLIESAFRLTVKTPSSDFTLTVCESAPVARRARRMVHAADLMLLIKFLLYFNDRRLGERQWELKPVANPPPPPDATLTISQPTGSRGESGRLGCSNACLGERRSADSSKGGGRRRRYGDGVDSRARQELRGDGNGLDDGSSLDDRGAEPGLFERN